MEYAGEEHGVHNAAFTCAKGRTARMDLSELTLEYQPDTKVYMFLALCWAVLGDVDLNSEVIRWAGEARFQVFGVYRAVNQVRYPAQFTYSGREMKTKYDAAGLRKEDLVPN
jgi:hypothetical protein